MDLTVSPTVAIEPQDEGYTKSSLPIASKSPFIRIPTALERGVPVQQVPKVKLNGGTVEDRRERAQTNRLATRVIEVNTPDGPVLKRQKIRIRKIRTTHPDDDLESVSSVDSIPTAEKTRKEGETTEEEKAHLRRRKVLWRKRSFLFSK
jgi:hypothetical protein